MRVELREECDQAGSVAVGVLHAGLEISGHLISTDKADIAVLEGGEEPRIGMGHADGGTVEDGVQGLGRVGGFEYASDGDLAGVLAFACVADAEAIDVGHGAPGGDTGVEADGHDGEGGGE